jgi:hypothetical protein
MPITSGKTLQAISVSGVNGGGVPLTRQQQHAPPPLRLAQHTGALHEKAERLRAALAS